MKINKLSASVAAGIIEAVKPYIATAEGRNFNFIYLAIVQTAAGYQLRAFTLQPDHQSFFEYDLAQDVIDLEDDAAHLGHVFRASFSELRTILRSAGTHDVSATIVHGALQSYVTFRVLPKKSTATESVTTSTPQKTKDPAELMFNLTLTAEPGSVQMPELSGATICAPLTLGRCLRAAYSALRTAGRDYRSSHAAHIHITPDGVAAEAITDNLLISSRYGREAIAEGSADIHLQLSPNSVRRIFEIALREGTETPFDYDPETATLTLQVGIFTYQLKTAPLQLPLLRQTQDKLGGGLESAEGTHNLCIDAFRETSDEDSTFYLDRKELAAIVQKFRAMKCGTIGIDFYPGGQMDLMDLDDTFSARLTGIQYLFAGPRTIRSFEVSVSALQAFLPLMTSDTIAITFGHEGAPLHLYGNDPQDTIHAVVKTL